MTDDEKRDMVRTITHYLHSHNVPPRDGIEILERSLSLQRDAREAERLRRQKKTPEAKKTV